MGLYKVYVGVQKKNRIFLKVLVHNFVQKIKHFPCFFLGGGGQNRKEKVLTIFWIEKKPFLAKKTRFYKVEKLRFSNGVGLWL